jgi:protein involved in polysaccharide export with SLBB domain
MTYASFSADFSQLPRCNGFLAAARSSQGKLAVVALGLVFMLGSYAAAQTPVAPGSPSSPLSPSSQDTPATLGSDGNRGVGTDLSSQDLGSMGSSTGTSAGTSADMGSIATATALPASQIIAILQQRPEVVVELKSLLADQMQQQGVQIQADSITDEMLYNQIAVNPEVRARVTTFLRARGYISDDTLRAQASSIDDVQTAGGLSSSQSTDALSGNGLSNSDLLQGRVAAGMGVPSLDGANTSLLPGAPPPSSGKSMATRRDQAPNASTDVPKVLRSPAPYNLQSLRDVYTQIPESSAPLKRFGSEVFVNSGSTTAMARGFTGRDTPLDVPVGPDYIVGPGDTLAITLWGGVTQSITRVVDRDGRILLPEGGSIDVAGLALGRAQSLIEGVLKQQYRNAQIAVTIAQLRSVRVYVVGDVQRPGGFDISSLATPLSALYAAGGPTAAGSLRTLRHLRGKQLIEEVDLYDFLLHGLRNQSARFESGDTLLVPPAGPQVAISGAVKRPAIYELKSGDSTLASVAEDAGGFTVAASLSHITVDRIDANRLRETVTLDLTKGGTSQADHDAIAAFQVKDGDRIRVAPILPYSERVIYLEGHVVRPGRQPYREGMRISDVLRSYQDMLPEPAAHGEVIRLVPPDLHAETVAFNVPDALIGNGNIELQPFDTIRIFGRYEIDAPKVEIHGEVLRPGSFPLSKGMTAAQLVRMAGGFKNDALLEKADLTSYTVADGNKVVGSLTSIHIGAAVDGTDRASDVVLKPGDILTIHQITGWNEIGESVKIEGQVAFPGNYGFKEGERLSSILRRAGGFRDTAYPAGAVLVREQVRELEQKSREELIRQIETSSDAARLAPNLGPSGSGGQTLQLIQAQQNEVLSRLKSQPPTGRLVVHLSADISSWENTAADIELRRGDVLTIPKRPGFVLVTGQVYNETALTFIPDQTAKWYLQHAGGTNATANRGEIFIIRVNGSVIGRHSGPKVLSTRLDPGDVIVVPEKVIGASQFWRNLLITAQLASSIAITAGIANL